MKSLSLSQPHAIVMVGVPGSGKTFFAEKFAETFNAPYIDVTKIAHMAGIEHSVAATIADMQLRELLKTKSSIIIEGSSDTRTERMALAKLLRSAGYQALYVWVQTDPETARLRSVKLNQRSEQDHDRNLKRFSAPHASETPIVISGKHTYATQAKVVLKKLSAPRADISKHVTSPTRLVSDIRRGK